MSYKPTYITDLKSGLVRDKESYLIPQDAFPEMTDAYIWRGRIVRREGYETLARFQRNLKGIVDDGTYATINGTNIYNIFTHIGLAATEPNAECVIASPAHPITILFAAPIGQTLTIVNNTGVMAVLGAGPITGATINYATGDISITANAIVGPAVGTVTLSYYPCLPAMDLSDWELIVNNAEQLVGFDQFYAYIYNNATLEFQEWIPGTVWNSNNSQFFWTTNYWQDATNNGLFWECNNNPGAAGDPIRYTNGVAWTVFNPIIRPDGTANPPRLQQALMLIPYKDRLLAFNTWEGPSLAGAVQFPQRVRWSQNGDPTVLGAIAAIPPFGWTTVGAWSEDTAGRGGYIDAPTNENIVSVANVRDVLIVGFERSTWQLRYTGNEILPFVWERINSDYGVESTFSAVTLNDAALGVGQTAIQVCNGNSADRIDLQIPDEVFNFHNDNQGIIRVHGIRDFYNELVYWTFPNDDENETFPNRVLVYNYRNNSYSFFRDSFTCFGIFQRNFDRRWQDYVIVPDEEWVNLPVPWVSGLNQSQTPKIVAGNQQGYVLLINELNDNGPSLTIRAITNAAAGIFTIPNHNLKSGEFIRINGVLGTIQGLFNGVWGTLNGRTYKVIRIDANRIQLQYLNNLGAFLNVATNSVPPGAYIGGGQVSFVNRIDIRSKRFNALDNGISIKLGYADILAETTSNGQFEFEVFADYNDSDAININSPQDPFFNNIILTSIEPFQIANQSKSWHRTYCPSRSQFYQFRLTLNDIQMVDQTISASNFIVYAIILWAEEGGRLV